MASMTHMLPLASDMLPAVFSVSAIVSKPLNSSALLVPPSLRFATNRAAMSECEMRIIMYDSTARVILTPLRASPCTSIAP